MRSDHAFTPLLEEPGLNGRPRSLLMSKDEEFTKQQIAQFSKKDAEVVGSCPLKLKFVLPLKRFALLEGESIITTTIKTSQHLQAASNKNNK